jgi:uncharacterized protein (DUF1800 family)
MQNKLYTFLVILLSVSSIFAQPYTDYIGAGHTRNVVVTSSSNLGQSTANKTINGSGLDGRFFDASRFVAQATLGADSAYIASVMNMGYSAWIDDQFTKPATLMLPTMNSIWAECKAARIAAGELEEDIFGPYSMHFTYAWWQNNMTNHQAGKNGDLLRQRVAMALSEILVTSANSDLGDWGDAMSSYYDILVSNSFSTYTDLLKKVSKSVPMGYYLSHLNNPKTSIADNVRPDENYAREIMQLFTIGLFKLNPNGTQQLDANGFPIPTYNNDDVKQMAKVFTGLYGGTVRPCPTPCPSWWPTSSYFGASPYVLDRTQPMIMSQANHEPGPKLMPNQTTSINITGNGMAEVNAAIEYLVNDPNTPPFIALRLIQRLIKSNPSPAYIQRVGAAFINNGSGVRGDLKAVVKAILMDPEARTEDYLTSKNGMLRAPTLKHIQFAKGNDLDSDMGRYWNNNYRSIRDLAHLPLHAPTVFNFYTPDFIPLGPIKDAGLVGPEFKILNSSTSVNYLNNTMMWVNPWPNNNQESGVVIESGEVVNNWTYRLDSIIFLNTNYLESIATDNEKLIHEMDKILSHGQLSDVTLNILRSLCTEMDSYAVPGDPWWLARYKRHKTRLLLYYIMISPDYNILK